MSNYTVTATSHGDFVALRGLALIFKTVALIAALGAIAIGAGPLLSAVLGSAAEKSVELGPENAVDAAARTLRLLSAAYLIGSALLTLALAEVLLGFVDIARNTRASAHNSMLVAEILAELPPADTTDQQDWTPVMLRADTTESQR